MSSATATRTDWRTATVTLPRDGMPLHEIRYQAAEMRKFGRRHPVDRDYWNRAAGLWEDEADRREAARG